MGSLTQINRRTFLQAAAAAPALLSSMNALLAAQETLPNVKIDKAEVFPIIYPMTGYFKFFAGPNGSVGRPAVVIKLTASDGTVGWGQSVPVAKWSYETLGSSTSVLRDEWAPLLIGRDPHDIPGIHLAMDHATAPAFSTGMSIARAGIDLALWDLVGKIHKKNVAELWGLKASGKILLSWTVNVRKLDEIDAIVANGKKRGYRNFNIKIGPNDVKFDVELARRVKAAAPDGFLWPDANTGYDVPTALEAAPKLADAGCCVLESAIKPNQIRGYQALVRQNALPIIMDEGVISPVDLEEFIHLKMLHGMSMKPSRCGGLTSNKAQIELCNKYGLMWLGSGLTDPDVSLAASLILYSAYGVQKPSALNGPQFLTASILKEPIEVRDGYATVPTGPGLGVEVDEQKLHALSAKSS